MSEEKPTIADLEKAIDDPNKHTDIKPDGTIVITDYKEEIQALTAEVERLTEDMAKSAVVQAFYLEGLEKSEAQIQTLKAALEKKTKPEIQALIEKYGDPQYKTSEFALYDVISIAQQLYAELAKLL